MYYKLKSEVIVFVELKLGNAAPF